jgi:hypothetical protein
MTLQLLTTIGAVLILNTSTKPFAKRLSITLAYRAQPRLSTICPHSASSRRHTSPFFCFPPCYSCCFWVRATSSTPKCLPLPPFTNCYNSLFLAVINLSHPTAYSGPTAGGMYKSCGYSPYPTNRSA